MKKLSHIIFIITLFLVAQGAFASEVYFQTPEEEVGLGELEIFVFGDFDENINAIEGEIVLPGSFEVVDISYGNSVINFWIEEPSVDNKNSLIFSGITPGGFTGEDKKILSFVVEPKISGTTRIYFDNFQALRNDGEGTAISVSNKDLILKVSSEAESKGVIEIVDEEKPEDFVPLLGVDPEIFDGQYFLVFTAQDKNSGIDFYQVREGRMGEYVLAESPYLIENQKLNRNIFVKAVDKSGNERIVVWKREKGVFSYESLIIFGIIAIIILFLFRKKLWRKFKK